MKILVGVTLFGEFFKGIRMGIIIFIFTRFEERKGGSYNVI